MPIVPLCRSLAQFEQTRFDGKYIATANPTMILETITELRNLKKEANWLARYIGRHKCVKGVPEVTICPSDEACTNCWREAARKAISEDECVKEE